MNNVRYNQICIFQSIAHEGSISAAARKLGVTPPSVSKALKLLEAHMGHPLFIRNTRSMRLTLIGQQLLDQTTDAIHLLNTTLDNLKNQNQALSGRIKITVPRFAYLLLIKPHLSEFYEQYPNIQLEISVNDGTINIINERFDVGMRFGDTLDEGMVARQLMAPFREGLYASKTYLNKYGMPKSPQDLSQKHQIIGYRFITKNRILPLILEHQRELISLDVSSQIICNDIEVMLDGIRQGLGIGRIFTPIHDLQADKAQLYPVLEDYWRNYPAVYIYYAKATGKITKVKAFIDFMIEKNPIRYR